MTEKTLSSKFTHSLAAIVIGLVILLAVAVLYQSGDIGGRFSSGTETPVLTDSDFEVTEYIYEDESSNEAYLLVVRNRSDYTVNLEGNTTGCTADGTDLGIAYNRINYIGPGDCGCLSFSFTDARVEKFEYELYYEISDMESGLTGLTTTESRNGSILTLTCQNTGEASVRYPRADILCFSGGALVAYREALYLNAPDSADLKPGEVLTKTYECDMDFDSYTVYYSCMQSE